MNSKRIQEIQKETAYPDSLSVQQALLTVWNETAQKFSSDTEIMLKIHAEQVTELRRTITNLEKIVASCGSDTRNKGSR